MQRIPGLLKDWCYYTVEPSTLPFTLRELNPAHPDLEGLVVVGAAGDEHRTIESAVTSSLLIPREDLRDAIVSFYERTLGVKMEIEVDHELIQKGFHNEWRDWVLEIYGTRGCRRLAL